jgi:hypothetical protein
MSIVLDAILRTAINPALAMLPTKFDSESARVMLLAITLQEAQATYRVQHGGGPAHGLWQFEEGGGVRGVMRHPASRDLALTLCAARRVPFLQRAVWQALPHDDILAAGFARLLLWTDTRPLPGPDASDADTWSYYERNWRPGKPHPEKWPQNHAQARAQVFA